MDKKLFIKGVAEKYPKELLQCRVTTEGNVIACLWKDPLLLDEVKLKKDDFVTKDGRFLFALAKSLRNKRLNVLDEVSVLSNTSDEVIDRLNSLGGYSLVENMTEIINLNNWDTYLDELYKWNTILKLNDDGFNLLKEIEFRGKKIIPLNIFKKMTSWQILDWYQSFLAGYDIGSSSEIVEEEDVYFEDDWEDELEEGTEVGTPYDVCGMDIDNNEINGFGYLSNQTLGLHAGHLMMIAGFSSVGKSTIFVTIIMALLYRGEKIIVISNEERIKKMKIKIMMFLLARHNKYFKLTKGKLSSGVLTDEDKEEIKKAKKYFNENYKGCLQYVAIDSNDMNLIKKKIRDAHLRRGFTGFLLDTFKLNDDSFNGERQDLSMVRDSRELHKLAMKYNLIGMCSCQCAERFKGTLNMTASVLAGSKQTKEILQQLFLLRSLYNNEELNPKSKYYCHPFRSKKVNGKWIEEEYQPDPSGVYIVLTVEKNRDGIDTPSDGVSYLMKFEGRYSTFKEVAKIRCKHGTIV